ncbi:30S ribosomal protein S17 [Thermodesulfovibrionales bacterium]|nr:30S ribosomal protein S17 [Thermodesulfovibrionales bacterium]MCL0037402.1 30S ribosomal protein S17 [Thermodesulfovibrionales bacterium]
MPKRAYSGKVIRDRMNKTAVVAVTRTFQHPLYKKTISKVTKFKAHDEENRCKIGDMVQIIESKPLSKEKRWQVITALDSKGR